MSSKIQVLGERKNRIQNQYVQYKRKHSPSKTIEQVNGDLEQKNIVRLIRQQLKQLNIDPSQWRNVIQRATLNGLSQLSTESDFLVRFVDIKTVDQVHESCNALQNVAQKNGDIEKRKENAAPATIRRKPSDRWRKGEPYNVAEALFGNDVHDWSTGTIHQLEQKMPNTDTLTESNGSDITALREMIEDCQNDSSLDHINQQQQPITRSCSVNAENSQGSRPRWRTPVKELPTEHWTPRKQDSKRRSRQRQCGEVISKDNFQNAAWTIISKESCRRRPCSAPSQTAAPNNRKTTYRTVERQRRRLRNPTKKIKFGLPYDLTRVESKIKVLVESDRQFNRLIQQQRQQDEERLINVDQCNEDQDEQLDSLRHSMVYSSRSKSPSSKSVNAYTTMEVSLDSCNRMCNQTSSQFL